jgi:hypothetical protein
MPIVLAWTTDVSEPEDLANLVFFYVLGDIFLCFDDIYPACFGLGVICFSVGHLNLIYTISLFKSLPILVTLFLGHLVLKKTAVLPETSIIVAYCGVCLFILLNLYGGAPYLLFGFVVLIFSDLIILIEFLDLWLGRALPTYIIFFYWSSLYLIFKGYGMVLESQNRETDTIPDYC